MCLGGRGDTPSTYLSPYTGCPSLIYEAHRATEEIAVSANTSEKLLLLTSSSPSISTCPSSAAGLTSLSVSHSLKPSPSSKSEIIAPLFSYSTLIPPLSQHLSYLGLYHNYILFLSGLHMGRTLRSGSPSC